MCEFTNTCLCGEFRKYSGLSNLVLYDISEHISAFSVTTQIFIRRFDLTTIFFSDFYMIFENAAAGTYGVMLC